MEVVIKSKQSKGIRYEEAQAKKHGGKHLCGPGKPDYQRGKIKGEVKNWTKPVHGGVIKKAIKNGVREIVSKSGFTKPAIELAKKKNIKLIRRGKKV